MNRRSTAFSLIVSLTIAVASLAHAQEQPSSTGSPIVVVTQKSGQGRFRPLDAITDESVLQELVRRGFAPTVVTSRGTVDAESFAQAVAHSPQPESRYAVSVMTESDGAQLMVRLSWYDTKSEKIIGSVEQRGRADLTFDSVVFGALRRLIATVGPLEMTAPAAPPVSTEPPQISALPEAGAAQPPGPAPASARTAPSREAPSAPPVQPAGSVAGRASAPAGEPLPKSAEPLPKSAEPLPKSAEPSPNSGAPEPAPVPAPSPATASPPGASANGGATSEPPPENVGRAPSLQTGSSPSPLGPSEPPSQSQSLPPSVPPSVESRPARPGARSRRGLELGVGVAPFIVAGDLSIFFRLSGNLQARLSYRIPAGGVDLALGILAAPVIFQVVGPLDSGSGLLVPVAGEIRLGAAFEPDTFVPYLRAVGGEALLYVSTAYEGTRTAFLPYFGGGIGLTRSFGSKVGLSLDLLCSVFVDGSDFIIGLNPGLELTFLLGARR